MDPPSPGSPPPSDWHALECRPPGYQELVRTNLTHQVDQLRGVELARLNCYYCCRQPQGARPWTYGVLCWAEELQRRSGRMLLQYPRARRCLLKALEALLTTKRMKKMILYLQYPAEAPAAGKSHHLLRNMLLSAQGEDNPHSAVSRTAQTKRRAAPPYILCFSSF